MTAGGRDQTGSDRTGPANKISTTKLLSALKYIFYAIKISRNEIRNFLFFFV